VLISASGHEYDDHGAHAFLKAEAPRPGETALWVHLGANVAARDWREAAMGMLSPLPSADPQRILMGSPGICSDARNSFCGRART